MEIGKIELEKIVISPKREKVLHAAKKVAQMQKMLDKAIDDLLKELL